MEKFLILTSVLALAACGSGAPGELSVVGSNARVTSMNSFVVVGGSNPTVNPNARSATVLENGGTQYDLENVTFKTIPTSGVISDLMFHTDEKGKIISIEFIDAEEIMAAHPGSSIAVGQIERKGDTNMFVYHDENGNLVGQPADMPLEYISYAKQLGLKYSDFGVLKTDMSSSGIPEFQNRAAFLTPFAGGYDVKAVDTDNMNALSQNGDIVFTGLAKGQVSYYDWDNDGEIPLNGGLTDNAATLTFAQDGSQTLAADFTNWAKIEAVKATDGTNQLIVRESYVANDSPYYIETSPNGLHDGEMGEYATLESAHSMTVQTGYYGDNNVPIEGVGLVQYQYMSDFNESRNDYENHINVDLGFGGIKN